MVIRWGGWPDLGGQCLKSKSAPCTRCAQFSGWMHTFGNLPRAGGCFAQNFNIFIVYDLLSSEPHRNTAILGACFFYTHALGVCTE